MKPWYSDLLKRGDPDLRAQVAQALLKEHPPRPIDHAGCVVEFLRGGRHRCGMVRIPSSRTRGLWVLDQEGRESGIRPSKVVDLSPERIELRERGEIVRALRQVDQRRERMKQALDLRTLWEIATEESGREWALDEMVDLYFVEEPDSDARTALARALDGGGFFARHGKLFVPLPAEVVEEHGRAARQQQQSAREQEEAAFWLRQVADGHPAARPEGAQDAIDLLEQAALFGAESERAREAAQLMKRAHLHGPLAAFEVLVKLGHWDPDENLDLLRDEVPMSFSAGALSEAEDAARSASARWGRRWWRGRVYGLALDGGVCEQAFSVRRTFFGYRVGIHLASPALLFERGAQLLDEAMERGNSLHLPDQAIPLLPPALTSAAGLTSTSRRSALTVELRCDRHWQIRDFSIGLRRVCPRRVLDGEEIEALLPIDRHLRWLRDLALARRCERQGRGEVILAEPEWHLEVREGEIALQGLEADAPARLISEELILLAGALVGEFCVREGIPAIYQVRPAPTEHLVEGDQYDPVRTHAQKKHLPRALLQVEPASEGESRAAIGRPFHRGADLLVHQQLAGFIARGVPEYSQEELERGLGGTAWAREIVGKITPSARRYWLLKRLESRVGQEVEAVVVERAGTGLLVELCEGGLKVFIPGGREVWATPGDRIRAKLGQVSARRDLIHLADPQLARPGG